MKKALVRLILVVMAMVTFISSPSFSSDLEEHLRVFQPLLDKSWSGGFIGEDAPDLRISLRFESILDGKAVRYGREAEGADFAAVTHFFWNPSRATVCFVSLNNRGIVEEGMVKAEGGSIVLIGKSHRTDGTVEFKTTLSIDPTGKLTDSFMRKKGSEWTQGHLQEFVASGGVVKQ